MRFCMQRAQHSVHQAGVALSCRGPSFLGLPATPLSVPSGVPVSCQVLWGVVKGLSSCHVVQLIVLELSEPLPTPQPDLGWGRPKCKSPDRCMCPAQAWQRQEPAPTAPIP